VDVVLRRTFAVSALLAGAAIFTTSAMGKSLIGIAVGVGLIIGSSNAFLIQQAVQRRAPFVAASIVRLALLTSAGFLAALLLGGPIWPVMLGVAGAQLVMTGVGVREGLRS
jgi:hypothetical protein